MEKIESTLMSGASNLAEPDVILYNRACVQSRLDHLVVSVCSLVDQTMKTTRQYHRAI